MEPWELPPWELSAREDVRETFARYNHADASAAASAPRPVVRHHVANFLITSLRPTRAEAAPYFRVLTGAGPDHSGRYRDVLVRAADRWLLGHRFVRLDAYVAGSWVDIDEPGPR